jgi:hypothetical protein
MRSAIKFGLLGGALAFTNDKVEYLSQQAVLQNACPSGSKLVDSSCQLETGSYSTFESTLAFRANTSQTTQTLDEARSAAMEAEDFPWTYWPECFSSAENTEPYCVFSDQGFASGRGVFILTTKPFAYGMLQKAAFTNPEVLKGVNQYESPPFIQHEFPGKGRGLVANKTLHRGSQIFASTPIVITDSDAYELPTSERLALLYRGVETLPAETQKRFWELMGHSTRDPVEDKINTNNFDVTIDGVSQQALFPEIAMMNHDCRPNAAYFWDESTMTQYVHAIRDIQPGEEITITYVDNEKDRNIRMTRLEKTWGFKCNCAACTAHPNFVAESDSRLYQITDLAQALDDWTPSSPATPEIGELMVSLYVQERLDASLATAYKYAAEVHSSFGNKWQAIKYARLSVEMSMLDKGFNDRDTRDMEKMAEKPEMTWSWNKRAGRGGKGCGCAHAH